MARPQAQFPQNTQSILASLLKETKTSPETKRIQCILFRVEYWYSAKQIWNMVWYSQSHVKYVWSKYKNEWANWIIWEKRWWRYNENMTFKDESEFIESFSKKAKKGWILVVSEIKDKYEEKIWKKTHQSVVYKMLGRHDWRKIVPRPSHPKTDLDAQQKFKDGFPPRG